MILHYKDNIKKLDKLKRKGLAKANLSITYYQNISLNNRNIFDQKTIAKIFNEYFVNVGPKLACEIPKSQSLFDKYILKNMMTL